MPPRTKGSWLANRPTHFISIPLITSVSRPQFEQSVREFRQRLGSINGTDGQRLVPDEAVKPVSSLHLTIGVLHLHNEAAFRNAIQAMEELDLKALNEKPLVIPHFKISSLPLIRRGHISHSPETYVVHLDPYDSDGRLGRLCNHILEHFRDRGLMTRPDPTRPHPRDSLTLHATLNNMRQRRPLREPSGKRGSRVTDDSGNIDTRSKDLERDDSRPIDATSILEAFASWRWAENVELDRVALCRMQCRYDWNEHGDFVDGRYEEVVTRHMGSMETS